ncbi:polymer-forming cytoskeletal protein [Methanohalobium sp.]|uniref:polymer-forming cytoskeletal protein n=1 Tax=Methanohalobium sp. TaxID=2837493 RepID=UPI003183B34D
MKNLVIPDNTKMEEHNIVVDGGVIVGSHSNINYGIIANSAILGESVQVSGDLTTTSEVRIDTLTKIGGSVKTDSNAYIGELVSINGKLIVNGDLDVGNNVKINDGFVAKGWIMVRNPIPVMVYLFLYISELLRLGKDEEVEKALEELFEDDELEESMESGAMVIPNSSRISMDSIHVPAHASIGNNCRLIGNIRSSSFDMGDDTTLYGSIRTQNDITIGKNNNIHGNIVAKKNVTIDKETHILGEVSANTISIHENARVDGLMRAPGGLSFKREDEIENTKDYEDEDTDKKELIKLDI